MLPEVIEQLILDYACIRRSNKGVDRNFIIKIRSNGCPESVIIEWVLDCLKTIAGDPNNDLSIVFKFEGTYTTVFLQNIDTNWCITKNMKYDIYNLTFTEEKPRINISADTILQALITEPLDVDMIGVSSISTEGIRHIWLSHIQCYDIYRVWYYNDLWNFINKRAYNIF